MWIKNVRIEDFGCFEDQDLQHVNRGINVIAGPQRAGKTTLMRLLEYLGFPFPEDDPTFPPPRQEYALQADLGVGENDEYRLKRMGYSDPVLEAVEGAPQRQASDLYGNLSSDDYRQLYTVDREHPNPFLQRLQSRSGGNGAALAFQSRLLGPGWSKVNHLTRITRNVAEEAESMGGPAEEPGRQFDPLFQKIKEALSERDRAHQEVEEIPRLRQRRDELQQSIQENQQSLEDIRPDRNRLAVIKDLYDDFERFRDLEHKLNQPEHQELLEEYPENGLQRGQELKQELDEASDQYDKLVDQWRETVGEDLEGDYRARLMDHQDQLSTIKPRLSELQEKLDRYQEKKRTFQNKKDQFEREAKAIRPKWIEYPGALNSIKTDSEHREDFMQVAEQYQEARKEFDAVQKKLSSVQLELDQLNAQSENMETPDLTLWTWQAIVSLVLVALGGYVAYDFHVWGGVGLMAISAAIGSYAVFQLSHEWNLFQAQSGIGPQIRELKERKQKLENRKPTLDSKREAAVEQLKQAMEEVGIPDDVKASEAKTLYEGAMECKKLREEYGPLEDQLEQLENELEEEIQPVNEVILELTDMGGDHEDESLESGIEKAKDRVRRAQQCEQHLELAKKLDAASKRRQETRKKIEGLLVRDSSLDASDLSSEEQIRELLETFLNRGQTYQQLLEERQEREEREELLTGRLDDESKREAFERYRSESEREPWVLGAYEQLWNQFSSREEVEDQLEDCSRRIQQLKDELDEYREKLQDVKETLETMDPDRTIQEARRAYRQARGRLQQLAGRYGRLRLTQVLGEGLYDRVLDEQFGPTLEEASDTFRRITGQDFVEVRGNAEDPSRPEFEAETAGGPRQTTAELSHGTKHQLFLSLRLARIRQMDPPLPLLLDDVALHYDPDHMERLVEELHRLASTHQSVVFSSQPDVVQALFRGETEVRFWRITPEHEIVGPFEDPKPLMDVLGGRKAV